MLVLIILIPNAVAKEKTAKSHLYFSRTEKSPQIICSFFPGFGTRLKACIDSRCNAFLILQDRAKKNAMQRNSTGNIIPDRFVYILKLEGNGSKWHISNQQQILQRWCFKVQ